MELMELMELMEFIEFHQTIPKISLLFFATLKANWGKFSNKKHQPLTFLNSSCTGVMAASEIPAHIVIF